jgi:glycosyltransferase involved in cell wall biosynthesis
VRPNWINITGYPNHENRLEDRILSVGRLEKQKNFELLIKSLRNSQITIDIVGDGSLRNDLITLASKYSVNLNLLGTLSNDELLKLYPKYKIFVLSSLYEGNPKVLLEAMAAGCLVLANKIESVDEIITHEENGILFNINDLDLINIINKLGNQTSKVQNLRKNAYLSVLKNNSFENSVDKELLDYKDLVF